jgi:hypothetical protein
VFPVRYELNSYINLLRNSVFKGLIAVSEMSAFRSFRGTGSIFVVNIEKLLHRVNSRDSSPVQVMWDVALEQFFSEYVGFPCQFSFHRLLHTHHLSSGAGTVGHSVDDVPS